MVTLSKVLRPTWAVLLEAIGVLLPRRHAAVLHGAVEQRNLQRLALPLLGVLRGRGSRLGSSRGGLS